MTRGQAYRRLAVVLLIFFLLSLAHSLWLPLHEAPDEVAHFLYSRFIADTGHLPINDAERELAGYKAYRPALYHILVANLVGWSSDDELPRLKFVWESPRFDLARELLNTKRLANTEDEITAFQGDVLFWHFGRLVSILLGIGTIIVAFYTALEIKPKSYWLALISAAIIGFVPTFIFISSAMSNDVLLALILGLYFLVLVKTVKNETAKASLQWKYYIGLGLLLGLAVTAKYSAVLVPLQVVGVVTYLAWRYHLGWRGWFKRAVVVAVAAIAASSWWFLYLLIYFNEIDKYGPVIGLLKPIIAGGFDVSQKYIAYILTSGSIGIEDSPEFISEPFSQWALHIYQSFWVREIGGYPLGPVAQFLIGVVCIVTIIGLVKVWQRQSKTRIWIVLFVSQFLLFLIFPVLRQAIQGNVSQTAQGRHVLFPVATLLPLCIVYGWEGWLSLKTQRRLALAIVGGLLCWSMAQFIRVIDYPIYYLPIRTTAEAAIQVSHRVDQSFGENLILLGCDTEPAPDDNALRLKLYWQSSTYPDEDYLMNIALVQNDGPWFSWSVYPLNGRYPTRIWESWETIKDDIWLPLVDLPPGKYQLQLQLYGSQGVLPVNNGDILTLGNIIVPQADQMQPDIRFSLSSEDRQINAGVTLWQAERYRMSDLPEYQPRMQIAFVWQGESGSDERISWLLVAPQGQVYPATSVTEHFGYFPVGLDWPSGDYRLRVELWREGVVIASEESGPVVSIVNKKPRLLEPPPISHSLDVNFANRVKLLGFDLPDRSLALGQGVPVTLYWQSLRTMGESYTVFAKLLDDKNQLWGNAERLPADGYNTFYWLENEVVIDGFELPVNPAVPEGIYWLNVGLYQEVNGMAVSLPLVFDEQPGDVTSVTIGPVKIGNPSSDVVLSPKALDPEIPLSIDLGEPPTIKLLGYDLTETDSQLQLDLYWESLAQMPVDWSVFVHVRDEAGETVAQKDGPAGAGTYPTSLWAEGEIVADEFIISLPDELSMGNYSLAIGLYQLETGERLRVYNQEDDFIELKTMQVGKR
jgi:4-amino-4-deoxy-L-arabinose transferase-like glycosyltransferase